MTDTGEPNCYAEVMEDDHKIMSVDAMQDEMQSLPYIWVSEIA